MTSVWHDRGGSLMLPRSGGEVHTSMEGLEPPTLRTGI